ncbi:hypothetical protein PspLS_08359 [Pyricularia sp. CBS 133598]|nr:hypothetical protein PspLS_08359 [Pyricularia sp. CBS 133598]
MYSDQQIGPKPPFLASGKTLLSARVFYSTYSATNDAASPRSRGTETTWTVYATKQRQPKINPENLQIPANPGSFIQLSFSSTHLTCSSELLRGLVQNYFGSP